MSILKVPPHSEEAEKSVLGSMLIDADAIVTVTGMVQATDFYIGIHELIYESMLVLYDERKPIDIVTLTAQIKKQKMHDKVNQSYLVELLNAVPTAANVEHYANIIKELSTKRHLIHLGTEIAQDSFDEKKELKETLEHAESSIFAISQGNIKGGFVPIKQTLAGSFDRIDELNKSGGGLRGIASGFTDLDKLLAGMQPANLIILAARPGQGKTAMAMNLAQYVAVEARVPIGIFSLEMSQEELVDRLLVGQADIDAWKLKTGNLSSNDFAKLSEAMGVLADSPIFIDDTPGITINEIRSKARRLQMEHNIGMLVVDYLQLVDPGRKVDNRVQEVGIVSTGLKNLARELKIPVLALSQLSRSVESRGDRKPQLSDLRESGSIEQDADVVMFIYRPDEQTGTTMQAKLLIAKHRNGATGEVDLLFRGDRIKFYGIDKTHEMSV